MSDIKYNTMRFGTDEFNPFIRQALLVSAVPVNLSNYNRLDQITVLGNQPAGSDRRFMFKMDDKLYKFTDQTLTEYSGDLTLENVLNNGNTAAQIEAVSFNRQLVGKNIFPIIALYTNVQDAPSAKLVFSAANATETLDLTVEHSVKYFHDYDINPDAGLTGTILGFSWDIETNGAASAGFKVKLLQGDTWSDYLTLTQAKGQSAKAVQPKYYYHVDAVNGSNSVKIKSFAVHWSPDVNSLVYGDTAYLFSIVKNFIINVTGCVLVVRHHDLEGGSIQAHASFQKKRKYISGETLSYVAPLVGANYFRIAHSNFILPSLKIYRDGVQTSDFKYNPAEPDIIWVKNPDGADYGNSYSASADYTYDADDENWLLMAADSVQTSRDGICSTRFYLANAVGNKALGAIRLTVSRGRNTVNLTATATGQDQSIQFAHTPDDIECDADTWYYDSTANIADDAFHFSATQGQTVHISYTWHGKTPVITGFSAAFLA